MQPQPRSEHAHEARRYGRALAGLTAALWLALAATPHAASAQPAVFPPATFTQLDTDADEPGCSDHRNVLETSFATDGSFLFLRMRNVDPAGWPTTTPPGQARYKWWFDTAGADAAVSGTSVTGAEFQLFLEDLTLNSSDPTLTRDRLGELTLMDDLANLSFSTRWDSTSPPLYTGGTPGAGGPSSFWQRRLGSGTAGAGGTQGNTTGTGIGYRIDSAVNGGRNVDMYVSLASLGNPQQVCLFWATDLHNNNLDQAPNCDRPVATSCVRLPTLKVVKDVVPDDASQWTLSYAGGASASTPVGDGGMLGANIVPPGTYSVSEAPAGATNGAFYTSTGSCTGAANNGTLAAGGRTINGVVVQLGNQVTCTFTNTRLQDFGDAPDPAFPTLLASNGARHSLSALVLGTLIDAEANGQPDATATGDDVAGAAPDDEDGVTLPTFTAGATESVTVTASAAGRLSGWIDFDGNGSWGAGEQVFNDVAVAAGANVLNVNVPIGASTGTRFARFRLCSATTSCNTVTGQAPDGEVEDYQVTIDTEADLSVAKSDSPDPVIAGTNLTYTLAVNNAGPSVATSLTVTDTLPAGVSFVSATGTGWACNEAAGVVTCTRASLAVGAAPAITLVVTVDAGTTGTLTNNVSVSATTPDPVPGNNADSEDTTVNASADLSVTKTDSPDPVTAGTNLTYTLAVSNVGPSVATSLTVTDTLPAGVSFVSATGTGWVCNEAAGVVTCTRASLAVGAAPAITVVVTVDAGTTGTLTNNVSVSATTPDPVPGNNADSEDTTVNASADLSVTKTDSPDPVIAGTNLTYTVTVTNNGPSDALNVMVADVLPAGVTLVSTTGCTEDPNGVPNCTLGTVASGASKQYTVTVTVGASTTGTLTNTAIVQSSTPDPVSGNNMTTEDTTVNAEADLSITKVDTPDPVIAGTNLTYTVTVMNNGPSDAQNVVVTDTLPAGVALVSTVGCAEDPNGVPTCTLGAIANGASKQYTITVAVDASTTGVLTNTATVQSSTPDPTPGNDTATEDTTVNAQADLSIAKTDSPDPVVAGNALVYTVTVTNNGPSDAQNVQVMDTLPAGVSNPVTNGCTNDPGGVPTCNLGTLAAGASVQYTITVDVDAGTTGTITNEATVTSPTPDPDPGNDRDVEDTEVMTAPAVPALGPLGLGLLATLFGGLFSRRLGRSTA